METGQTLFSDQACRDRVVHDGAIRKTRGRKRRSRKARCKKIDRLDAPKGTPG